MGAAYLIYGDVEIVVDAFSNHRNAIKKGETRILDPSKPLRPQVFEALSGKPWDEEFSKQLEAILDEEVIKDEST